MEYKSGTLSRKKRLEKGWTQESLAKEVGMRNQSSISFWETGRQLPSEAVALKVANALEIPEEIMSELLGEDRQNEYADVLKDRFKLDLTSIKQAKEDEFRPENMEIHNMLERLLREERRRAVLDEIIRTMHKADESD